MELDIMENWLNAVSYGHSGSLLTTKMYRMHLTRFLQYIGKTAGQLQADYEASQDRDFKRKYAQYLMGYVGTLQRAGYSPGSLSGAANSIKSFFKYSDFPLGYIPNGSSLIENHNRDITKDEVLQVLQLANPRDRAFFVVLTQSGLRPGTVANLKIGDVEGILEENTPVPCLITVRRENTKGKFQEYFSFIGAESVSNLKDYLKSRSDLKPDSFLFTAFGSEKTVMAPGVLTHIFRRIVEKLRESKNISYKTNTKALKVKDSSDTVIRGTVSRGELRLYCLRKYFRKFAAQAGLDYVNFWMGHTSALGVDLHYFSRDVEFHRKQYREKAMPFLRLETRTPSETEKQIEQLQRENKELKHAVEALQSTLADHTLPDMTKNDRETMQQLLREIHAGRGYLLFIDEKDPVQKAALEKARVRGDTLKKIELNKETKES